MRARTLLAVALLLCVPACGEDAPPTAAEPPAPAADGSVEAALLRRALAKAGVEVEALRPLKYDSTKRLLSFPVAAKDALATWTKLRAYVDELGHWPLIVQESGALLGNVNPKKEYPEGPAGIIAEAEKLNSGLWLDERQREDPDYYKAPKGEWKELPPSTAWGFLTDFEGKPAKDLRITLVPTTKPWEVCAWFFFGGWNACPPPAVHVAVQKRWYREYGAEIVFMTDDVIETTCPRRPPDREAALELGREHFLYSGGDLIHQGYGSMRELASALLATGCWYFWWD